MTIRIGGGGPQINMDRLAMATREVTGQMPSETQSGGAADLDFSKVLRAALDGPNAVQQNADDKIKRFVSGEEIPVHEIMASLAEADVSMRLLTQVTSRVISAYQELARIQV